MKKLLCSVRDIVADTFSNPFTAVNQGTALRDFGHACVDPDSALNKSPDSYALYVVGEFDDDTGLVTPKDLQLLGYATNFTKGTI